MNQWNETSIGWFVLDCGLVSVVLMYDIYKKAYKVGAQGFFSRTEYPTPVVRLEDAKRIGIQLLVRVLEDTLERAKDLEAVTTQHIERTL